MTTDAPIYESVWRDLVLAPLLAPLHAAVRICPTCPATGNERCREGGRFVGRHEGRAS